MRTLRVGVIGVGHLGQHHARLYSELPGVTLVGVADRDPIRSRTVAKQYGAKAFPDSMALLGEIDAVSIAVPTLAHHAVVKDALQAGVHVLVEKPIAATREEAVELIELAKERARILQVGHIERFNPAIQAMRSHIGKPSFMECYRLGPFGPRGTDVDVVRDLMIHDLDMILSFKLGAIEEVQAAGVRVLSSTIDAANARITFENGCMASLTASRVSASPLRELRLYQQDSCITIDYRARRGTIHRRSFKNDSEPVIYNESIQVSDQEPLKLELQSFIHSVATGAGPLVSGHDGLAALDLAHQVLEAIGAFRQRHDFSDSSLTLSA